MPMKIMGIETSCDETAVCIIEAIGSLEKPQFKVLGNALFSQVKLHEQYGGVFPMLAKREHVKNIIPLFKKALEEAGLNTPAIRKAQDHISLEKEKIIKEILAREKDLIEPFLELIKSIEKPDIDAIAVTAGPGLEPALWVGISFAQALGAAWSIPVLPTNHMEGHIMSVLLKSTIQPQFPALALLISGGHTELVLIKNWFEYEVIGQTRDDAVGEAFDKVARLLSLPYPGGPEISKLAQEARTENINPSISLPRPMLKSPDLDFSFSGIKTAVLYAIKKIPELTPEIKKEIALEFENAVTEVLVSKTKKALELHQIKTLILGGGVTANAFIRENFKQLVDEYPEVALLVPEVAMSTDNAVMIAIAGYLNFKAEKAISGPIKATGNLSL